MQATPDVKIKPADTTLTTPATAAMIWHTQESDDVLRQMNVSPAAGLSAGEVESRLSTYGANELTERASKSVWSILWEQLTGPLVLLLIGAAVVSAFLQKWDSVIAISAIVIINAILGVVQEYRAEQAMAALKRMSAPLVRVRRDGKLLDVQSSAVVPGDVIVLEAGSVVPADSRLLESANLRVQEASLTGESQPVEKAPPAIDDPKAPLGDRHNMLYMGTSVTYGRGTAVIVETGMKTQLGRIADLIQSVDDEQTPLQRRTAEVGRALLFVALGVTVLAFIIGIARGEDFRDVLVNAVAIAVAVVPEGLPAVLTIALALGAQRMLKRKALIRKLPAVETLGSVTVICSDKTGTLTENRMTVTTVDVAGHATTISALKGYGQGISPDNPREVHDSALSILLAGGALCNDAEMDRDELGNLKAVGDPTEGSIVIAAADYGLDKEHLEDAFPRIQEVPFESDRKRMTTIHNFDESISLSNAETFLGHILTTERARYTAFTKGGVDNMLLVSDRVWVDNKITLLTPELKVRIESANADLAKRGLRVLGVGFRTWEAIPEPVNADTIEKNLVFVGLIGIIDPPRKEVRDAVQVCLDAGIRPVMITGDHPLTALNIAQQLRIAKDGDRVVTGVELNEMTPAQLDETVRTVSVFARVSPENKLSIVGALQKRGEIAAMTGDGVNDAPALKKSDIGVAMGITGTAVSREASDMVILDDNFATIVSAVEEGRTIYDNVRRFIKYLLASNSGELFVLIVTQLIAGMTLPLTTLQILWMNLTTDGIPALALGVEKGEPGGMKRNPIPPGESIFARGMVRHILLIGLTMGAIGVALGYWAFSTGQKATNGQDAWKTMVYIFLTIAQMGHALALRSHRESIFKIGILGNRTLLIALVITTLLQLATVYLPFTNQLFGTSPLTLEQLAICVAISTAVFWVVELEKLLIRRGVLKG